MNLKHKTDKQLQFTGVVAYLFTPFFCKISCKIVVIYYIHFSPQYFLLMSSVL